MRVGCRLDNPLQLCSGGAVQCQSPSAVVFRKESGPACETTEKLSQSTEFEDQTMVQCESWKWDRAKFPTSGVTIVTLTQSTGIEE